MLPYPESCSIDQRLQQLSSHKFVPAAKEELQQDTSWQCHAEQDAPPQNASAKAAWKQIQQRMKPPLCKGHGEPSVIRQVKKGGPNQGKEPFPHTDGFGTHAQFLFESLGKAEVCIGCLQHACAISVLLVRGAENLLAYLS